MKSMEFLGKIKKNHVILLISLLLSIVGSVLIYREFNTRMKAAILDVEKDQVNVLVLKQDMTEGMRLNQDNVGIRVFPRQWLPSYALIPKQFHLLDGKVLNRHLRAGDLLGTVFVDKPLLRFSEKIRAGYRAVTIAVDDLNSVSGMISPGDVIDLYLSFVHEGQAVTAPVLQQVRVIATGRAIDTNLDTQQQGRYSTVTLELKPEDALKLMSSKQEGQITALLRSPKDKEDNYKAAQGDMANLLGIPGVKKEKIGVKVIYGNDHSSDEVLTQVDEKTIKTFYPFIDLKDGNSKRDMGVDQEQTQGETK